MAAQQKTIQQPKESSEPPRADRKFIAVIGDMVGSRRLSGDSRRAAQREFAMLMEELNTDFSACIAGKFAITQGDEFEGLLWADYGGERLPALIWRIEERFPDPILRLGIGLGFVETPISDSPESAIVLDGPAFHRAREAVVGAAKAKKLGGVFLGFGEIHERILNGIARVLQRHRARWSRQQRRLAMLLHTGLSQTDAAKTAELSKQAVSAYVRAAGWNAYLEGELAFQLSIAEALRANGVHPARQSGGGG